MVHAYCVKTSQSTARLWRVILEVQHPRVLSANPEALESGSPSRSKAVEDYGAYARCTLDIQEPCLEHLFVLQCHASNQSDLQNNDFYADLQSKCCEAEAVTLVFPQALQELIEMINTTAKNEEFLDWSLDQSPNTRRTSSTISVDPRTLHTLCNSTVWVCLLGMLTSDQPRPLKLFKLFIRGIETYLETFLQSLKTLASQYPHQELMGSGALRDIYQMTLLDKNPRIQQRQSDRDAEDEDTSPFGAPKFGTIPRSAAKTYTHRRGRLHVSEDLSLRDTTPRSSTT